MRFRKVLIVVCIILAISIIVGFLVYKQKQKEKTHEEILKRLMEDVKKSTSEEQRKKLKIIDFQTELKGDYIYVTGSVKNVSNDTITYYEIRCDFLNTRKEVVDSDYTNSGQDLYPEQSRRFEIMHKWHDSMDVCGIRVDKVKTK